MLRIYNMRIRKPTICPAIYYKIDKKQTKDFENDTKRKLDLSVFSITENSRCRTPALGKSETISEYYSRPGNLLWILNPDLPYR